MGKQAKVGDEISVTVERMASDGRGVGQHGDRTVKVEGAIPGETVGVRVFGKEKRTLLGRAIRIEAGSPHRIEPRCVHFGECGGCSWQHIEYPEQLELKRRLLIEALEAREIPAPDVPLPLGVAEPWFYRNKMDFDFGQGAEGPAVGLHRRGSYRTLLDLKQCLLQSPETAPILETVRQSARELGLTAYDLRSHAGQLRSLLLLEGKRSGEFLVQIVTSEAVDLQPMAETLRAAHPRIAGVLQALHTGAANVGNPEGESKLLSGSATVEERIAGITLRVGPQTFLQRNTEQAERLYRTVLELASPTPELEAIDLYCGFGPISHLLAPHVRGVTGIELVPDMIEEARRLAEAHGRGNLRFLAGAAEELLPRLAQELKPGLVVANPPRAGIHKKALRALAELRAPRLVYVSCAPATLADNLRFLLDHGYGLERIQPVDLFPQTPHLETVVALNLGKAT